MTDYPPTTITHPPPGVLPADLRGDASELLHDLAAAAGNESHVLDVLEDYTRRDGVTTVQRLCSAALVLTFAECLTPVHLDHIITNRED